MNSQGHVTSIQNAYLSHMQRQKGLTLCKTLIELLIEIQKHRGCTLAILSGDRFFETQLFSIQRDITEKLKLLDSSQQTFLTAVEVRQILGEWVSIRRQWHKDSIQENFLLHSNLINELSKYIWLIVERSNQLHISKTQDQLLGLSLRDGIQIMEVAAQARGLATHIAAGKNDNSVFTPRLTFLCRQLTELNHASLYAYEQLESTYGDKIHNKRQVTEFDEHLKAFQEALTENFIDSSKLMDTNVIYTLGSQVVSASHQILLAAIRLTEQSLSPELEAWINGDGD